VGIISDIQHAIEPEQGTNYHGDKIRYYLESANTLSRILNDFKTENVSYVVSLGDLLDGFNSRNHHVEEAMTNILDVFSGRQFSSFQFSFLFLEITQEAEIHHCIGNHELYCYPEYEDWLLAFEGYHNHFLSDRQWYYSFYPIPEIKFIILNTFFFSAHSWEGEEVRSKASELVRSYNPNEDQNGTPHLAYGHPEKKWVLFNGGLGEEQIAWLDKELEDCYESNTKAVICSHGPLSLVVCDSDGLCWDSEEVQELIFRKYPNVVLLCLSGFNSSHYFISNQTSLGHTHQTWYGEEGGVHFLGLDAVLEIPPPSTHSFTLNLSSSSIVVRGKGETALPYLEIPLHLDSTS